MRRRSRGARKGVAGRRRLRTVVDLRAKGVGSDWSLSGMIPLKRYNGRRHVGCALESCSILFAERSSSLFPMFGLPQFETTCRFAACFLNFMKAVPGVYGCAMWKRLLQARRSPLFSM